MRGSISRSWNLYGDTGSAVRALSRMWELTLQRGLADVNPFETLLDTVPAAGE